jgi:hypothetical protein
MTHKVILRDSFSQVFGRNASCDSPMNFQLKVILRDSVSQVLSSNASNDFSITFDLGHFQMTYF